MANRADDSELHLGIVSTAIKKDLLRKWQVFFYGEMRAEIWNLGSTISLIFLNERSEFRKILRLQARMRAIPSSLPFVFSKTTARLRSKCDGVIAVNSIPTLGGCFHLLLNAGILWLSKVWISQKPKRQNRKRYLCERSVFGSLLWWLILAGEVTKTKHKFSEEFMKIMKIFSGIIWFEFEIWI